VFGGPDLGQEERKGERTLLPLLEDFGNGWGAVRADEL
jgi:hypothetical protein